ncbi:MAG: MFS transporter, partial [Dehalococcoidia bacterium]
GAVSGPAVGGALVELFGWRSIFVAIIAVALSGSLLALLMLREERIGSGAPARWGGLDWPGSIASALSLVALILSITNGNRLGWGSPIILGGFGAFAALFAGFVWWERRAPTPMIDLAIFRSARFTWASLTRFTGFLANGPMNFLMPFYLQQTAGWSPSRAGLILIPLPLAMGVVGAISGSLSDRLGVRRFMLAGILIQVGTLLSISRFQADTPLYVILATLLVHGTGAGLWQPANMSAAVGGVHRSAYGVAAAFLNLVRNTANVIAVAVTAAFVAGVMVSRGVGGDLGAVADDPTGPAGDAFLTGMRWAFSGLAAFLVLALAAAAMAGRAAAAGPDRAADATQRRPGGG